ncbi:T9SS type A sorting domain-containing protein [Ulvibacter antarcticus]|uniref:Putative secreted protein (Por secretion system target) n=1 Tax=Ulvibacter antarcticus TaxID=442714 RepID=A0A3L9YE34_9FLAO|nr:T9SS type A sorting domain-containing protein [Ulvibacter antarcticus]RMA58921.1 putative secreted protein (Por secretion system target) [Ulvibacter antarcticus]
MLKRILFIALTIISCTAIAQGSLKTMFYNLLDYPEYLPGDRSIILQEILDTYEPDIFMVCELKTPAGANEVLNIGLNDEGENYTAAPFEYNQSGSANLQQLLYFRSSMFSLVSTGIIETSVRDINRYVLQLNTADQSTDPILIHVYVTHLKSSQGGSNVNLRLDMVNEFTSTLPSLDPNSFIIFAGDLNLYTSTEPAYIELLDPTNAIVMADPIDTPGSWNNNSDFQQVHTQSTRTSSGPFGAGAGGGMDDRFDFILISENMKTDPKLRYVDSSYKSFGNNGNCYNKNVNDVECVGEFDVELRNKIYAMSDHLPVVMELETNKEIVLSGIEFDTSEALVTLKNTVVTDNLFLKISQEVTEPVSFRIYNTLGQEIMQLTTKPSEEISIDLSQLDSGIYYLKNDLPFSETTKFLKIS